MMGRKNAVFFDDVRVPATYLVGGENSGWKVANTHLELEHGGEGSVAEDPLFSRVIAYCQQTRMGGKPLIEDPTIRGLLADMFIDLHVGSLFSQRNFWHRYTKQPHPYGGVQGRYHNRMTRLKHAERLQQPIGYDALLPDLTLHERADFEHTIRSGPGQLHGGGTLDTDRVIFARRLGLGRPTKEEAPTTV